MLVNTFHYFIFYWIFDGEIFSKHLNEYISLSVISPYLMNLALIIFFSFIFIFFIIILILDFIIFHNLCYFLYYILYLILIIFQILRIFNFLSDFCNTVDAAFYFFLINFFIFTQLLCTALLFDNIVELFALI